jgi:GDP-L-fucose synthase
VNINKRDSILIAGHSGLVGSSIVRKLKEYGYNNLIFVNRKKIDLTNQKKTLSFLKKNKPKFVFICAAKVGGIYANNKFKADFIYENLMIQNNLIHGSYLSGVKDLIFLGSSCVYPRDCKQPIKENYLLSGPLEETNDAYAIAKIAGIKMCESYNLQYKTNYKCLMPCNTFGPGDNYNVKNSHFLPALIRKIDLLKMGKKKNLELWGTGKAKREFLYVEDLADACIYFMNKKTKSFLINIGSGKDQTILKTAKIALNTLKVKSRIIFDKKKIDGTPRKLLDVSLAKNLGWTNKTSLKDGILKTYNYYVKHKKRSD